MKCRLVLYIGCHFYGSKEKLNFFEKENSISSKHLPKLTIQFADNFIIDDNIIFTTNWWCNQPLCLETWQIILPTLIGSGIVTFELKEALNHHCMPYNLFLALTCTSNLIGASHLTQGT